MLTAIARRDNVLCWTHTDAVKSESSPDHRMRENWQTPWRSWELARHLSWELHARTWSSSQCKWSERSFLSLDWCQPTSLRAASIPEIQALIALSFSENFRLIWALWTPPCNSLIVWPKGSFQCHLLVCITCEVWTFQSGLYSRIYLQTQVHYRNSWLRVPFLLSLYLLGGTQHVWRYSEIWHRETKSHVSMATTSLETIIVTVNVKLVRGMYTCGCGVCGYVHVYGGGWVGVWTMDLGSSPTKWQGFSLRMCVYEKYMCVSICVCVE